MATREEIRAVFADPQLDWMECLYGSIGKLLLTGAAFETPIRWWPLQGKFNPPPGSSSACNAPPALMSRQRSQSSWRCWRSSAGYMLGHDQLIKQPSCEGVKCVRICQEIDREHQFPLLFHFEFCLLSVPSERASGFPTLFILLVEVL